MASEQRAEDQRADEQNLILVKRLYDEYYNKGNPSICNEIFTNNVKINDVALSTQTEGIKACKDTENIYKKAFPDKKTKIDEIFTSKDIVIARWSTVMTHKGDLQGIAPTNKEVKIKGISIYYFTHGKINQVWQSWDRIGLLEQIGAIQPLNALR